MVPGHEIAGVGCMVDSCGECGECGECEACKDGQEQFCAQGAVMTHNSHGYA